MRHLSSADYRVMPWKNGGGTTTEIAIFPPDSGLGGKRFAWRISIADVACDGPFSRFPGYDRQIMTIAGKGMRLDAGAHGVIDLTVALVPRSFSGDWDVMGSLIAGPVRDFNVMADRATIRSSLGLVYAAPRARLAALEGTTAACMLRGEATAGGHRVGLGDALILEGREAVDLLSLGGEATLAMASFFPAVG